MRINVSTPVTVFLLLKDCPYSLRVDYVALRLSLHSWAVNHDYEP
jgi:hypothetical protein